jgi:hypothetical protein
MIFEKMQLESDETVLTIVRRHWFYLVSQVIVSILIMFLPLIAILVTANFFRDTFDSLLQTYFLELLYMYAFWLLINWMVLASLWTDHYLDIWVITNHRIININQVSLFRRQVGTFRLERLQDVNVEIHGIIETLLDFGTIHAETASGTNEEFKARHLPHPRELKSLILQAALSQANKNNVSV